MSLSGRSPLAANSPAEPRDGAPRWTWLAHPHGRPAEPEARRWLARQLGDPALSLWRDERQRPHLSPPHQDYDCNWSHSGERLLVALAPQLDRHDLRRVSAALRWGRDMRQAWTFASPGWAPAATALVVSSSCGAPASEVLRAAATQIREDESRRLEAAAGRAGVLLVLPLGLCFLPAFVATSVVPILLVLLGESLR